MIINADQIEIILVLGGDNATYKLKSYKQVLIYEKNKKCTFTYVTSVKKTRQVLATQSV